MALERRMSFEYRQSFIGQRQQVLLEETMEIEGKSYLTGHTKEYVKVAVKAQGQRPNTLVDHVPEKMLTEEILF